jgi:hypothetical protein
MTSSFSYSCYVQKKKHNLVTKQLQLLPPPHHLPHDVALHNTSLETLIHFSSIARIIEPRKSSVAFFLLRR